MCGGLSCEVSERGIGVGISQALSVRLHEWLPNNVARNSLLTISTFEFMSLELQRFRGLSKTDRGKLRATCVVGRFASSADRRLLGLAVPLCDACPQGWLGARGSRKCEATMASS